MAGSLEAFVRDANSTAVLNIPYRFWGLEPGAVYRMILVPCDRPGTQIPYSFDVEIRRMNASTARVTIPRCVTGIKIGDRVQVWIGRQEDFDNEMGWAFGRGITKEERTKYLEEQTDILRRCAGQQIHNERVP